MIRRFPLASLALLGLLGGCATGPRVFAPDQPGYPEETPSSYQAEPGRDAATIAEMRAAPPPEAASLQIGNSVAGDYGKLTSQGFVRVGTARYSGDEGRIRDEAGREARSVGADRVLLYLPNETSAYWQAMFYVRFKLPFGATFRDLTNAERSRIGGGVQIGSVVGGTPAARANLLAGDFVTQVNGRAISGKSAFQDELRANTGRKITLTIVRNGETLQRALRLGSIQSD